MQVTIGQVNESRVYNPLETSMKAINPATGKLIREYKDHSAEEARAKLDVAMRAFADCAAVPLSGVQGSCEEPRRAFAQRRPNLEN